MFSVCLRLKFLIIFDFFLFFVLSIDLKFGAWKIQNEKKGLFFSDVFEIFQCRSREKEGMRHTMEGDEEII